MEKSAFEKKLKILNELGNELSTAKSVSELCKRAVELGRKKLGFDRLSTWFIDNSDPDYIIGCFGVDEKGCVREEIRYRVVMDEDPAMRQIRAKMARSVLRKNMPLRDHNGKVVGHGSHIIAAIWNGKEVIGYLSTDNLLKEKPLTEYDRELAEMFAATFGHLYSLKKAEEALHTAYNKLKDVQQQLIQTAKMDVIGGLASGVAHEVKNPLAVMLQGVEYLVRKSEMRKDDSSMLALQRMKSAIEKANGIVNGLLDFSTFSSLKIVQEDLNSIIESSLLLVKHGTDKNHIRIVKDLMKDLPLVKIDKNKIEQVLLNIFLNAIYEMPKGGRLTIRTYVSPPQSQYPKSVFLEIEDTGPGVPKNILGKVFDPFITTKRASGGTGLGLTIARNIMEMHKGKIIIENVKASRGAKVTMVFRPYMGGIQ